MWLSLKLSIYSQTEERPRVCLKTILITKFPQLLHALASLSSAYFQESEEERDNTLEEFFTYAVNIIEW